MTHVIAMLRGPPLNHHHHHHPFPPQFVATTTFSHRNLSPQLLQCSRKNGPPRLETWLEAELAEDEVQGRDVGAGETEK